MTNRTSVDDEEAVDSDNDKGYDSNPRCKHVIDKLGDDLRRALTEPLKVQFRLHESTYLTF